MLKQKRGSIIAISSLVGRMPVPCYAVYAATKHALHGFFDSLRVELVGCGITPDQVNGISICKKKTKKKKETNKQTKNGTDFFLFDFLGF